MRINREECSGLVVDIQERIFNVMEGKDELLRKTLVLLRGLKALEVPVLVTEQYPKGLGSTLGAIREAVQPFQAIEKITFSCCGQEDFLTFLERTDRKKVIICGIEAHVCVLQTAVDLLEGGYLPVVVADCTASRQIGEKIVALERMRMEGALVTTCESLLFELTRNAGTELFKTISNLVK